MKLSKFALRLTIVFILSLFLPFLFSSLVSAQSSPEVKIHLFWGDGCPHCAIAKPFLEQLAAQATQVFTS